MHDIIVIGGGPAGLTAALYARRAGKTVLVLEKNTFGGQIVWSPKVENYPTISSVSGLELGDRLTNQVLEAGAELELDEASSVFQNDGAFLVSTAFGSRYEGKTVIFATGAAPRKLGLPREEEFIGSGISFCAVCDGEFYRDKVVGVVGGGNTALQEALYLSDICKEVHLIHRRDAFRADQILQDSVRRRKHILCHMNATVESLMGEKFLTGVRLQYTEGIQEDLPLNGLFVAAGHEPENAVFRSLIALDSSGYANCSETCITGTPGIYVAGDCRAKDVRQLTTAVADGTTAALAACHYIDQHGSI